MRRLYVGTRRERVAPWALVAVALAVAGIVVTVWRPLASPVGSGGGELGRFGTDVLATVREYRQPRYLVAVVATALGVLVPLVFVASSWGRRRVASWSGPGEGGALRAALLALRISVVTSLVVLPLAVYVGIVHDGQWGFRTRSTAGWFLDWFLRASGRWLTVAVLVGLLVVAVRRWPASWPYRVTVVGTALVAAFVLLHPLVVQPLFLPTGPLADGPARDAITTVLERGGAADLPVHVGEASRTSTRVNALVTGLGPTERVVVYDNLLELPEEQIGAVVAHELAHHEHLDLPRGVALSAAVILFGSLVLRRLLTSTGVQTAVGARHPADARMAAVVLAAVALGELAGTPVANLVSRRAEAAADARAVELTQQPGLLLATTRVFTVRDLSDPDPPRSVRWLYGSHPTVAERIDYLEGWAAQHDLPLPDLEQLVAGEADQRHPAIDGDAPDEPGGARP
ncbi:MAG TPA: M48 family metalloprotease [Egicoccus sp.]|nr:M48 family metalloprotease [Egicoccus sp.]HSK24425.1 M48 family metalloprotease [Egicoccus sp.]